MRHSILLKQLLNRALPLVLAATFAMAGCSAAPPVQHVLSNQDNLAGLHGPVDADCPVR